MKGLAITAMILGIVAIVINVFSCGLLSLVSGIIAIVGVILAGISMSKYKKVANKEGKGMAVAGLVLSIITLGLSIILYVSCVLLASDAASGLNKLMSS